MRMLRLAFFLLFLPTIAISQDGYFDLGARNHALGGTSVTLCDAWALFNNSGASGNYQHSAIMSSYQNRFNLEGFHVIGGGGIYHQKWMNLGVKYFKFGDHFFNQQLMGVVISNHFQMISLGGGLNIIQTHTEGVNTKRVWVGEFGGTAELTNKIVLGAHIFNFKNGSQYPTTMKAGLSFRPTGSLMLNAEIEKQLQQRELIKTGVEYAIIQRLFIRTGVRIQGNKDSKTTIAAAFGLGFRPGRFIIDYAYSSQELGAIHEISLVFELTHGS